MTRREHPDVGKLIEWVLNIAETRHRAWQRGEPDPYGLRPPTELTPKAESARSEVFVLSGCTREDRRDATPSARRSTMRTIAPDATKTPVQGDVLTLLAVSYLRVSTREQAERGGTDEGFNPSPARSQRAEG